MIVFSFLTGNDLLFKIALMDREMRYIIEAESQKTLMKENCDKRLARIKAEDYERHKNLAEYALNIFDVF
tara:strand:- start:82 stop:291 length:210 start_codon:yes stop_codon:yes gene_type:complete